LPVRAQVLARRDEDPSGGQRLLVSERLQLPDRLVPQLKRLLGGERTLDERSQRSQLDDGTELEGAISERTGEHESLLMLSPGGTKITAILQRRTKLEQQLHAFGTTRRRERDGAPEQFRGAGCVPNHE
jgi:hypothetical protein